MPPFVKDLKDVHHAYLCAVAVWRYWKRNSFEALCTVVLLF
uniref:Uncharacterized protein n=1 Tax=Arundo donax TaxID=35708 RepID=A0A0A8YFA1_ARUDO